MGQFALVMNLWFSRFTSWFINKSVAVSLSEASVNQFRGELDEEVVFRVGELGRTHVAVVCHSKSRRLSIFLRMCLGLNVEDERKRCGRYRHPMNAKADRITRLCSNVKLKKNCISMTDNVVMHQISYTCNRNLIRSLNVF